MSLSWVHMASMWQNRIKETLRYILNRTLYSIRSQGHWEMRETRMWLKGWVTKSIEAINHKHSYLHQTIRKHKTTLEQKFKRSKNYSTMKKILH